jgi:hypothetical protein
VRPSLTLSRKSASSATDVLIIRVQHRAVTLASGAHLTYVPSVEKRFIFLLIAGLMAEMTLIKD